MPLTPTHPQVVAGTAGVRIDFLVRAYSQASVAL